MVCVDKTKRAVFICASMWGGVRHAASALRSSLRLALACVVAVAWARVVHAEPSELSAGELVRVHKGETVIHEQTVTELGQRYIGGTAYVKIAAPCEKVLAFADNPDNFSKFLPRTKRVRWIGWSHEGDWVVELVQGNAVATGRYTIRVRTIEATDRTDVGHPESAKGGGARLDFWLDPQFPHDIDDARGSFRFDGTPEGGTMVAYTIRVSLGPGLFKSLFSERIRQLALSTASMLKQGVESQR